MKRRMRQASGLASLLFGLLWLTTAEAQQPFKIGFGMALTGGLAAGGKAALLTYQIWQEEINAKGGLLGRKVELVFYDDQSSPATVPGIYSKLIDIDKVDIVLSGYGTVPVAAAMPEITRRKKMFLAFFALAANEKFKYDRYFQMQPSGPDPEAEFAKGFFELAATITPKPKTVAIVGADQEFAVIAMTGARAHAKRLGFEVVYDKAYPPSTIDFAPVIRAIKASNPELLYMATYPPDSSGMIRAIYESGFQAKLLGGSMVGLQFAALKSQLGPLLNNVVCYDYYAPEPTMKFPGVDAFLEKYRGRAAKEGVDVLGLYIPPFAYSQMQILEDALKAVGSTDDGKLAEYMHKTTFKTIVGDMKFGERGEWEAPRVVTVQYRGIVGNDVNQFLKPGVQTILYPQQYKSGDLIVGFDTAAAKK